MVTKLTGTAGSQDNLQILPGRILVVDDEPSILFAYQRLLRAEGYCVDSCGELDSALDLVQAHEYFAIITDIRLSGTENCDGVTLLSAVRAQHPDAKTIVVTGFGDSGLEQTLMDLGITHYLEKPVKPSLILELLKAERENEEEKSSNYAFSMLMPEINV
ncbi:MAG: response regulator [Desulfuromonadaceae bacterium]